LRRSDFIAKRGIRSSAMTLGRTIGLILLAAVMAVAGYAVSYWHPLPRRDAVSGEVPVSSVTERKRTRIEAQGRLEPANGTLTVGAIPGEKIVLLHVSPGQFVRKDEVLAVLGSHEIRQVELALAEQQLEQAKRQLAAEQRLGALRQEVAELSAEQAAAREREIPSRESIEVAEKRLQLAATRLKRLEELRDDPRTVEAIADAELEQQRLLVRQIEVELSQSMAQWELARQSHALALRAARLDITLAELTRESLAAASPVGVLEQSAALAALALSTSLVRAPSDGTILEVYVREGERVANTPILQMGDLRRLVCVAEVHEASLRDLGVPAEPPGNGVETALSRDFPVTIRSGAFDRDLTGRVVDVGRLIGAPALRDPNPLAATDRRTAKVRIELDEESAAIARHFIHLQVHVTIQLAADAGAPHADATSQGTRWGARAGSYAARGLESR
jgi:HlyD family secretion protein